MQPSEGSAACNPWKIRNPRPDFPRPSRERDIPWKIQRAGVDFPRNVAGGVAAGAWARGAAETVTRIGAPECARDDRGGDRLLGVRGTPALHASRLPRAARGAGAPAPAQAGTRRRRADRARGVGDRRRVRRAGGDRRAGREPAGARLPGGAARGAGLVRRLARRDRRTRPRGRRRRRPRAPARRQDPRPGRRGRALAGGDRRLLGRQRASGSRARCGRWWRRSATSASATYAARSRS